MAFRSMDYQKALWNADGAAIVDFVVKELGKGINYSRGDIIWINSMILDDERRCQECNRRVF